MTATVKRNAGHRQTPIASPRPPTSQIIRTARALTAPSAPAFGLLAAERGADAIDIHAALTVNTYDIMHFAKRHRVSLDADLRDLKVCSDREGCPPGRNSGSRSPLTRTVPRNDHAIPRPPRFNAGRPGFGDRFSTLVIVWFHTTVSLVSPAFGAVHFCEVPAERHQRCREAPDRFICELRSRFRRGLVLLGEGQFAISDRSGVAHGISNPTQQKDDSSTGKRFVPGSAGEPCRRPDSFSRSSPQLGSLPNRPTSGSPESQRGCLQAVSASREQRPT